MHAAALHAATAGPDAPPTGLTNVFSGRPARGILNRAMRELGPMSPLAPAFPLAGGAIGPLRARAEAQGSGDFTPLWAGQGVGLGRAMPAGDLTRRLMDETAAHWERLQAGKSTA